MSGVVHFKFRNAIAYDTVLFDGHFISVGELKRLITEKKQLGRDATAELILSDPRTGVEYTEDSAQIAKNTSVLVRRAPAAKTRPIQSYGLSSTPGYPIQAQAPQAATAPVAAMDSSATEVDEFGGDPYAQQAASAAAQYEQEEKLINNLVRGTERDHRQALQRGAMGQRGRGRGRFAGRGTLPAGYICHRCGQPGHHIRDCPTNEDPNYDMKRVRHPAGIPITKLRPDTEGGLLLPGGNVGALLANDKAFAEAMAALPTVAVSEPVSKAPQPTAQQAAQQAANQQSEPKSSHPPLPVDQHKPATQPTVFAVQTPVPVEHPPTDNDDFDFNRGATDEASKLNALFDEEEPTFSLKPVQLGLGMGMAQAAERAVGPAQSYKRSPPRRVSPQRPPAATQPSSHTTAWDNQHVERHLLLLQEVLPRGPVKFLVTAFLGVHPLEREEFESLQQLYNAKGRGSSREPSQPTYKQGGGSRTCSKDALDHPGTSSRREPGRTASLSPEPRYNGGRRGPVGSGHTYPLSSSGHPHATTSYRQEKNKAEASEAGGKTLNKQETELSASHENWNARGPPEKQTRQSRLLEENSRVDRTWESTDENAEPSAACRRAASVEVSTDRVEDRYNRQNKRGAGSISNPDHQQYAADQKRRRHSGSEELAQHSMDDASSEDDGRGEEKKRKKHKKHKKHKEKEKHKDKHKHKDKRLSAQSPDTNGERWPDYHSPCADRYGDQNQVSKLDKYGNKLGGGSISEATTNPVSNGKRIDTRYMTSPQSKGSEGRYGDGSVDSRDGPHPKRGGRRIEWRPQVQQEPK